MKKVFLLEMGGEYGTVTTFEDKDFYLEGKVREDWEVVECEYVFAKYRKGDFFGGITHGFGLYKKTYDILKNYLERYVQFLPVEIEGQIHYFANVTHFVDCFDFENSYYRNVNVEERYTISGLEAKEIYGDINKIPTVLFKYDACIDASKVTSPIFYTKDRGRFMGPYVTSGFFNKVDEFYHILKKENLKGLEFLEIKLSNL